MTQPFLSCWTPYPSDKSHIEHLEWPLAGRVEEDCKFMQELAVGSGDCYFITLSLLLGTHYWGLCEDITGQESAQNRKQHMDESLRIHLKFSKQHDLMLRLNVAFFTCDIHSTTVCIMNQRKKETQSQMSLLSGRENPSHQMTLHES